MAVYDDEKEKLTPGALKAAEENGDQPVTAGDTEADKLSGLDDQVGRGYNPSDKGRVSGKNKKKLNSWQKAVLAVGGGGLVIIIVFLFFLLTFFKLPHFSQVLTASGYARLNSILQERSMQNIFDASLVEGNSTIAIKGKTLFDRLRFSNPDAELAKIGRQGDLSFIFDDGKFSFEGRTAGTFQGLSIKGKRVTLDGITKELGFGNKYSTLLDTASQARVRFEFTKRVKSGFSELFATEPRYVRSRAFKYVTDSVGFKFSRWRQKARDFVGKNPVEAYAENIGSSMESVSGTAPAESSGFKEVDETVKDVKAKDKLIQYLKDHPEDPTLEHRIATLYKEHIKVAEEIRGAAEKVGQVTMVAAIACIVNQSFDHIPDINRNNYANAEREGLQLAAAGSQTEFGDVNGEAVQAETHRLEGADQSPKYQYDTGNPNPTTPDNFVSPALKPRFSPKFVTLVKQISSPTSLGSGGLTDFLKKVPGIGYIVGDATDTVDQKFCQALLSPAGFVVATAGEVVAQAVIATLSAGTGTVASEEGAGVAARLFVEELVKSVGSTARGIFSFKSLVSLAGLSLLDVAMQYIATLFANQTFSGAESGANYYERASIGTDIVQSHAMRTSFYGKPLSGAEVAVVDKSTKQDLKTYWSDKGSFSRYFGKDNPFSLIGSIAAVLPNSLSTVSAKLQHVGNLLFSPSSYLKPLLAAASPTVFAESKVTSYDPHDGIQQWGYSNDELQKIRGNSSYSIQANEQWVLSHPNQISDFEKKYADCFTTASQYDADELVSGHCNEGELSTEIALRYRIYKGLDSYTVSMFEGQDGP